MADTTTLWLVELYEMYINTGDLALVQSVVAKAITSFEPRLLHLQLEVAPQIGARDGVFLRITAAVLLGQTLRRVQFDTDVAVGGSSAR